ncbi:HAD family phosphatase [Candidatus Shapirobacteria bacterium]|nr:HAD family phosphatase [Candidatus Shapirobacteria bacterium]
MKPLSELTREDLAPLKLLCFDCDGVVVTEGTKISESEGRLVVETKVIESRLVQKLNQLKSKYLLAFSSGRSLLYLTRMFEPLLYDKVIFQAENGLFFLKEGELAQLEKLTLEQLELLKKIKHRIRALGKSNSDILGFEPKQFLVTVHCKKELEIIPQIVKEEAGGQDLYCLWSGEAYDINFAHLNKGRGLEKLCQKLGIGQNEVMAIGNDPNDREMIEWAGIGVTSNKETMGAADYYTLNKQELGGEELVDKLLELI